MTAFRVVAAAAGRVWRAPAILIGVWVTTLAAALPLMFVVHSDIARHLGSSLEAETVASGANHDWMLEFAEQSSGVSATFTPSVIGFASTLDNVNAFIEGEARPLAIAAVAAGAALLWTFLAGGIIDRYARDRRIGSRGFFQACGGSFWPLLRLGLLSAVIYAALLTSWRPWLLGTVYDRLTRDVSAERVAFAVRLVLYVAVIVPLAACNLIVDYAKVRTVVEDRLSAIGALRAAVGFVRRHAVGSIGVYTCNWLVLVLVVLAYAAVDPGAGSTGASMWMGLAVGQAYIVARLWTKLLFWGSAVEWFLTRLAHSGYAARRLLARPEPAVVEQVVRPGSLDDVPR